jgi:hypothetical protein
MKYHNVKILGKEKFLINENQYKKLIEQIKNGSEFLDFGDNRIFPKGELMYTTPNWLSYKIQQRYRKIIFYCLEFYYFVRYLLIGK